MKRTVLAVVAAIALLFAISLWTLDYQAAFITDNTNSNQSIASAKAGRAGAPGSRLMVHLAGERSLFGDIEEQLAGALQAKELLFDEVIFVDAMPTDGFENPALVIYTEDDGGFWTPFYANTHLKANLLFAVGTGVNPDQVLTLDPEGFTHAFDQSNCIGSCSTGHRTVELSARTAGLVSLPHLRAYAAGKLVQEAVQLVGDGLPDSLSPEKWSSRASELASEKLAEDVGPTFSSFQRMPGCRGGVVVAGGIGEGADWRVMYYDAAQDAITEVVTRADVVAKAPGQVLSGMPGVGFPSDGLSVYVDGVTLRFPAERCTISGWEVE